MTGLAADPLDPAVVRLRQGRTVLGAGFLVAPDVIATCAHVVGGATPVADFPLLRSRDHAVEVLSRDDDLDVAILRLADAPPGALPVPARITGDVRDHRFRTFGFPHDMPDGIWVTGRLVGAQGAGRIQMAVDPDHWRIERGFSGAPVWDEELRGVVGMVATTSPRSETTAHLVPTTALGDAWTTPDRNPYRGLRPFREEDAALFHGRDDEVEELLELLAKQDMIAIAGPSGSGKSSLVRAGLLPRLQRMGATIVELGAGDPIDSVPVADGGTVLFLDQFEEAVAADPEAARARLGQVIERIAARPVQIGQPAPLRVVLTLRSRSLDDLTTAETRKKLNQAVWLLEPMRRESLREAITRPAAEVGGLAFEVGLVDAILHDSPPEHGTLPLLSELLKQLWDRRHGGWLTHAAYQELGRLPGALSKHADAALATLRPEAAEQAKRLLVRLTRPDGEGGYARRSVGLGDLDPELREVAHDLAAKRLVLIQDRTVNLTHQALIDQWAQLRDWLDEDADFLAWQAKLQQLQDAGGLLRGAPLTEAADWLRDRADDLPAHQEQFIRRSVAAQRRTQSRWRTVSAAVGVLALVSAVLTGVVLQRNGQLEDKLHTNNATTLAQVSTRAAAGNPAEALQMALAAWRERPDSPDAYGALLAQRINWLGVDRVLPPQMVPAVRSIDSSADGRVVVVTPDNPAAKLTVWWDLQGPNPTSRAIPDAPGSSVALSPDGRMLAVYGGEPGLRLWDLTKPAEPVDLAPGEFLGKPAFSANGRFLAVMPSDQSTPQPPTPVRVWDLDGMREVQSRVMYVWDSNAVPMREVFPSPDGRSLVITEHTRTSQDGVPAYEAVVRDLATGAEIRTIPVKDDFDAHVLDNGTHVAACVDDALTVFDSSTGGTTARYPVPGCSFEPDVSGQYLLIKNRSNSASPAEAIRWRTGARLALGNSAMSSSSWGTTLLLVPAPGGGLTAVSIRHNAVELSTIPTTPGPVERQLISESMSSRTTDGGRWITYASDDTEDGGELVLLDADGAVLNRIPAPRIPAAITFDATGERIAVVFGPTLRIYRTAGLVLEREARLPVPDGHDGDEVNNINLTAAVAVAPNGGILVSHMGILSTWDVEAGVQTTPPLALDAPAAWDSLPGGPNFALRPGHPEQIVVQTSSALSIWDYQTRKSLASFPLDGLSLANTPAVTSDGSVAATIAGTGHSVALIDLDNLTPLPPLVGKIYKIDGITSEYLFAEETLDFQVWDWREHRLVAAITLDDTDARRAVEGGELIPNRLPGHQERIPLDPEVWFRDLCRISDRDFTDEELGLLPEGVSRDRPCDE